MATLTRNELALAIRRKIALHRSVEVNKVSWKYCYGVAGQRIKKQQPKEKS